MPLRTPELSLTSHSSTDIKVNWQPLPAKVSRGRLSAYRLSFRTAADNTVTSVEVPQNSTEYLLKGLQPDTIYLLRMAAATRVGWCEPSAWTSHRTPKTSSSIGKHSENWKGNVRISSRIWSCLLSKCITWLNRVVFFTKLWKTFSYMSKWIYIITQRHHRYAKKQISSCSAGWENHVVPNACLWFCNNAFFVVFRIQGGSLELTQSG